MKLNLIDGMNLLYRLDYKVGFFVGNQRISGIENFLYYLRKVKKFDNKVIVCWDAGRGNRNLIYKEYKRGREPTILSQQMMKQGEEVRNHTILLGIPSIFIPPYEADDLIATYALMYSDKGKVKIHSSDSDLFQLVDENISVDTGKFILNKNNFENMTDCKKEFFILRKAIVGDRDDNIYGVKGVGIKTFNNILRESNYDVELFLYHFKDDIDLIERNIKLIQLKKVDVGKQENILFEKFYLAFGDFYNWVFKLKMSKILNNYIYFTDPFRKKEQSL